jgi:uncharacterized protein (TIGR02145 family)
MNFRRVVSGIASILIIHFHSGCVPEEIVLHGKISGHVTDVSYSQPLDSALVALTQSGGIIDTKLSANDGSYQINNVAPGNYELEVSKPTFETTSKNVTVESTKTANVNFEIGMLPHPSVSDDRIDFGLDSETKTFTISNVGAGTLRYSLFTSQDWILIDSNEGDITTETDTIQVSVNRTGLSGKEAAGEIRISYYSGGELKEAMVEVLINGVMDIDGNYYGTVTIGTQTWLAENLNTGKMFVYLGAEYPFGNNGEIDKYCMQNHKENCDLYGGTYAWFEMTDYPGETDTTGMVQGVCPAGWHIPSYDEWETLINYLGGTSVAGGMLKDTGTIENGTGLWFAPNTGASNPYGFKALPGGSPHMAEVLDLEAGNLLEGQCVEFWTSSQEPGSYITVLLWFDHSRVEFGNIPVETVWPAYVRCIKDPQ